MSLDIQVAHCTMKEFRDQIDGDERMLKFAADNLDTPDDATVEIQINGQFVTFGIVSDAVSPEGAVEHCIQVKLDYRSASCPCGWSVSRRGSEGYKLKPFTDAELDALHGLYTHTASAFE